MYFVFGNCNHCCFCCGHPFTMLGVSLFIFCKNKIQCVCVEKKCQKNKKSKNIYILGLHSVVSYVRGPQPGPRPGRNGAAQQEVSGGLASEASSAAPHCSHYRLNNLPATTRPHRKIFFHETGPWCQKGWGPLS